ncbi:hypothetical protein BAE44_0015811 [Dichanthelium oligosanthes]|uniref:Uncharacterized protein n=1 Tax=Dichanthelium oligosanthes TaxID=888268 RepID=A0A1E5VDF6_9POAL|nr:hypothetical protein BAE44_0015811 [Dichanthelium oligosanthes]
MWVEPALAALGPLKDAGLTGIKVLWILFERRIQPLKAWVRPLFQYSSVGDLMRVSPEVLEPTEVKSRVWTVIKKKMTADEEADLNHLEAGQALHLAARREGYDPPCLASPHRYGRSCGGCSDSGGLARSHGWA